MHIWITHLQLALSSRSFIHPQIPRSYVRGTTEKPRGFENTSYVVCSECKRVKHVLIRFWDTDARILKIVCGFWTRFVSKLGIPYVELLCEAPGSLEYPIRVPWNCLGG